MIDLHIHTKYSDGTDEVLTILKKAEEKNLKYISITDHNNCDAYKELENIDITKYYSGKIITGVELNTKALGIPIEILGYGIDVKEINLKLKHTYLTAKERNKIELERLYKKCIQANIKLPDNFIENYDYNTYASKYLHKEITNTFMNKNLIDEESWNNSNIFYRKYMSNPNTMFFVDTDDILPDFETASNLITDTGGLVFIPHIYEYRDNANKILDYILKHYEIQGIECYYTTFTKEQSNHLIKICKEKKLFMSGGSDYHGSFKPDVDMAIGKGDLSVSENIVEPWIYYVNN